MILKNKVALVTGGTSGIGRATAIALGAAGAECLFVRSDVSSEADVKTLVQTTIEKTILLNVENKVIIYQ